MNEDKGVIIALKWAGALAASWWVDLPYAVKILTYMTCFDFATGIIAGGRGGGLASGLMFIGIRKKVLMFVLVGLAHFVSKHVISETLSISLELGQVVATFYALGEFVSCVENCSRAGVPIPKPLREMLLNARKITEAGQEPQPPEAPPKPDPAALERNPWRWDA